VFISSVTYFLKYKTSDNDFQSPAYGKKYNDLQDLAFDDGRLQITKCPDKV
jgi:hypothetical protein